MVNIFQYPIYPGDTRDLLRIPGVDESDIRGSLLKGEIKHKLLAKEITVVCSDIDLLQFNDDQRAFLQLAGIVNGLTITADQAPGLGGGGSGYYVRQGVDLVGLQNGSNRIFYTPDIFIQGNFIGNDLGIEIYHNGRHLANNIDYKTSESGGIGTGFNTITFLSFAPISSSTLKANYSVKIT